MIGGLNSSDQVLRNNLEIDPNMTLTEKSQMGVGRFNVSLGVVQEKKILAIGGMVSKGKPSEVVELYDPIFDSWYQLANLERPRCGTSCCVINSRFVFVFPGTNTNSWNTIEMLDIGTTFDLKILRTLKWSLVTVTNADFM